MRIPKIMTLVLAVGITAFCSGADRLVPGEYPTIKAAVTASEDGDVIILSADTYRGADNRNINPGIKSLTIRSTDPDDPEVVNSTVINCEGAGRAFHFEGSQDSNSMIAGLTIMNGNNFLGGAVYCSNASSPIFRNCVISNCTAGLGGAFNCGGSSNPEIENCTIRDNSASLMGGGIYCNAGSPPISNSILINNSASSMGGAIHCAVSELSLLNCTLSGNTAGKGGGIYSTGSSNITVLNSILWADAGTNGPELFLSKSGGVCTVAVSYCNVQGGNGAVVVEEGCTLNWGAGNKDTDPMFVTGPLGDYYLDSDSDCVDGGSGLAAGLGLDGLTTQIDGVGDSGIVDMGYHYPTIAPSTTPASINITPNTISLARKSIRLMSHIRLPEGYDVADIVFGSIFLQGNIPTEWIRIDEEEQVAMARFEGPDVEALFQEAGELELTVTGQLTDGTMFSGRDVIRVKEPSGKKPAKGK